MCQRACRRAECCGTKVGRRGKWICPSQSMARAWSARPRSRLSERTVQPQFVIGIDLGTTNSALAFAPLAAVADPHQLPAASLFPIPQVTNPGEVRDEPLLPSSLYLPGGVDFPPGSLALPWEAGQNYVVGRLAQKRGAENPGRLVSSA